MSLTVLPSSRACSLVGGQRPARMTGSISCHAKARLEPSARIGFLVRQIMERPMTPTEQPDEDVFTAPIGDASPSLPIFSDHR